jgi:ferrous iron transport protein B
MLHFNGIEAAIVDLPGIYSLSTYSLEEIVTRDYIAREKPDVVINVIGAPVLERNLFFTLQLLETGVPMVVCLNQVDAAQDQGIEIDARKLAETLGVPVVPTVAARGQGIKELVETALRTASSKVQRVPPRYGDGIEDEVQGLAAAIEGEKVDIGYSSRWVALKLLERDEGVVGQVESLSPTLAQASETAARRLEARYHQPSYTLVAAQRYARANEITRSAQRQAATKTSLSHRIDRLTTHKVFGYIMSIAVLAGLLLWTFTAGNGLSNLLSQAFAFFQPVNPQVSGPLLSVLWNGVFGGLVAGITLVLPYVVPFYLLLAIMEDSGILTRVAFMMDGVMHQMGLHGKAIIPLILGYGCNVPAIYTTRVMATRRERLLASFAVTFAPCAARTIVILGLVAAFVGTGWALALYGIDLLVMFIALKLAVKVVPGQATGLIMEMHSFKAPSMSVVLKQTWSRTKSLAYMVMPMYMIGTALVQGLYVFGVLNPVNGALSFLTVTWLGLPAIAGVLLIFGVVRKELILLTLVAIYGTGLRAALTPDQFIVLALVGTLYLPCVATVGILAKEFGWKAATAISAANLGAAVLAGGIATRLLALS